MGAIASGIPIGYTFEEPLWIPGRNLLQREIEESNKERERELRSDVPFTKTKDLVCRSCGHELPVAKDNTDPAVMSCRSLRTTQILWS